MQEQTQWNKHKSMSSSYFTVKMALTQEQVRQAQMEAGQTFPFSWACPCVCFIIFSWQQNMNLKTKECCWAVFFINQWKHLFCVHSWFYQDGRSRRKFEERVSETVCLFPVFFMMVPFSLDTRSLCLFLCLFIIPVLIGVPWPHRTFFGVNFLHCLYLVSVPVVLFNPGNPNRNWLPHDLASVCFIMSKPQD